MTRIHAMGKSHGAAIAALAERPKRQRIQTFVTRLVQDAEAKIDSSYDRRKVRQYLMGFEAGATEQARQDMKYRQSER